MSREKNGKNEPNFRSRFTEKEQVHLNQYKRSQRNDYEYI